jgi:hypothetical protein
MVVVVVVLVSSMVRAEAQTSAGPTCDVIMKDPAAFVGKTVSFFGSMTGFDMKPINGKQDTVNTFACKTKDGQVVAGGSFAFLSSESKFTDAAGKANTMKSLFFVSGTVRDPKTAPAGAGSIPLLTNVQVKLADEP